MPAPLSRESRATLKPLTVAACGPQRVMVPSSFSPDACRAVARAVVGAVGATLAKGQDIHWPAAMAQRIAQLRADAWVAGDAAWAAQVTRDEDQATKLEAMRARRSARAGEPSVRAALVALLTTTDAAWQAVRNTLGHPLFRDIPDRHATGHCDTCLSASLIDDEAGSPEEHLAAAARLVAELPVTGAMVLDLYRSLRAGDKPSCPEAVEEQLTAVPADVFIPVALAYTPTPLSQEYPL